MYKSALISATLFAMFGIILGAFGAHALKPILGPELLGSFETGVRYQFYHAVALFLLGIYGKVFHKKINIVFILFVCGIILFSGSIYLLCLLKSAGGIGLGGLGILTPIGGILLVLAWAIWCIQIVNLQMRHNH